MNLVQNEQWLSEKYSSLTDEERKNKAFVSLKIKRLRILNGMFGSDVIDDLIIKIYRAIEEWLEPDECVAHIYLGHYNLLMRVGDEIHLSSILERVGQLNRLLNCIDESYFNSKIYFGYGIFPLASEWTDFRTAQYKADICRSESMDKDCWASHMEIYGISYQDSHLEFPELYKRLLRAYEKGHITIYLQPKVDLKTGEIKKAEALVRWIDPELGMIPLPEFLPTLENNGQMYELDLYVFKLVCKSLERWKKESTKEFQISVNLSRNSFNYAFFLKGYQEIFEKYDCEKHCIEIELLESIILNHEERVNEVVREIDEYGFKCSLDDFGSGYSSYSVLMNERLSVVKIDRSLIRDENNQRERELLKHIIDTIHSMKMKVVAEGVESESYVEYLREIGCDYVQGYVYYRPMPVEEFEERFLRGNETIQLIKEQ